MVAGEEFGDGVDEPNLIWAADQEDGGGFAHGVWVKNESELIAKVSVNWEDRQLGLFCHYQAWGDVEALEAVLG